MIVVIPTYGRDQHQKTLENLPRSIQEKVVLVVQDREKHRYSHRNVTYTVLPPEIQDIATTRDWIIRFNNQDKILMLDDDLEFAKRREDDPTKFREATEKELEWLFLHISDLLDIYPHVSVSPREGANRNTDSLLFNGRAMRVLGYRTSIIKAHNLVFSPATFMCDFHMTLCLLRLGYANCIINSFVNNQSGSNTAGGCSSQRTPLLQTAAAEFLQAIHPDFVTTVKKFTKTSWGGTERTDVRVQWKKAFESAAHKRSYQSLAGPQNLLENDNEESGSTEVLD